MSIDNLRTEVRKLCNFDVRYICEGEAKYYGLSTNSPANTDGYNIYILDCISKEEQVQAEAHELGHIYIKESGLICLKVLGDDPICFLKLELNNALSHRFVVSLVEEYGISNEVHIYLRKQSMKTVIKDIMDLKDEPELMHGIGLKLYDISVTIPELNREVERVLRLNNDVKIAYDTAVIFFSKLYPETPKEEQGVLVNRFFNKLGYTLNV